MKKFYTRFVILIVIFNTLSLNVSAQQDPDAAWMPDANLRAAIKAMQKTASGEIRSGFADGSVRIIATSEAPLQLFLQTRRELNLDFREIKNLTGLEYATGLFALSLTGNRISDLSPLADLPKLGYLSVARNQISDLRQLVGLTQVRALYIDGNPISDFRPLAGLTQLKELGLTDSGISDLRPLAGLTQVRFLYIDGNPISDFRPLAGLTQLERLGLTDSGISDLRPLAGLTQLQYLDLSNNPISDLRLLVGLTQLQYLDLSNNPISDLRPLAELTQLQYLDLSNNQISDVTPLAGLTHLIYLYLDGNQISDVTPLAALIDLEELLLSGNPIQDASPLDLLAKLVYWDIEIPPPPSARAVVIPDVNLTAAIRKALDLGPNASITQQAMPTLTTLDAVNLQIDDLTGLEHATQLKELMLTGNRIRNIRPLAGLTQLVVLELQDNQIKDVSPLAKLTQLETLNLNNNEIRYVSLLGGLTQLKVLRLAGNNVRNVSTLTGLVNLETLEIAKNPITDIMPLAALTKLRDVDIDIPKPPRGATTGPASTDNVVIPDANLAKAMRKALGLGSNARITKQTLQDLTRLDAEDSQIKNLTGLEHATQLVSLLFYNNQIRDIKPLAGLKKLTDLRLDGNQISDISPLAELTQLELLHIGGNQINNDGVQILANLTQLRYLSLYGNQISNITPLTNLTKLMGLWISNNQIRDVSPLAGLANLETLHLKGNPIQDTSLLASLAKLRDVDIEITQPAVVVAGGAFERPPMYWIDTNSGTLHRLVGAEVENLLPSVRNATDLAIDVDGGKLYWMERTSDRTGRIRRANLDSTNVQLVKNLTSVPHGIALDTAGGKIYLTNSWGKVQRLNVDGSNFQPNLITGLNAPRGLALDVSGGKVYWTEASGRVRRANLDGSNIQNLPAGPGTPMNIAVSNSIVYWTVKTGENRGEIRSANLSGVPNVTTYAEFNQGFPIGIAVDTVEAKLYWTTSRGKIGRGNTDESSFQTDFAIGLNAPGVLTLSLKPKVDVETKIETPKILTSDAVISLSPSSVISPAIGEQLTISLNIAAGEAIAGYDVTVQFDATALHYVESSNGDYLPAGAFFTPPAVNGNHVTLASTSLTGVSNGDGTLATLIFEVVKAKASTLSLRVLLTDREGNYVFPHEVMGGQVTEPPKLKLDVNGDGVVNIQDLVLVASSFGKAGQDATDVNADGVVNIADLVLVAGSLSTGLGAPSLYPNSFDLFTTADVSEWLLQAHQLNSRHVDYQPGVLMLEQLLLVLTPKETVLLPNYPNPFNPETWIPYQLSRSSDVNVTIYDARGVVVRRLALGHQPAGYYTGRSRAAYWDGRNGLGEYVASGIYFYQLETDGVSLLRKMVTLK